jgi:hypothetical protein
MYQENRKYQRERKQDSFNPLTGGQLTTLILKGWVSLTDFATISICRQYTNLKVINLDGCKNLTYTFHFLLSYLYDDFYLQILILVVICP